MAQRLTELISAERVGRRVEELAVQISRDYRDRDLLIVGVLKGCFMFLADLLRRLELDPTVDFLRVASYGAATESSGVVEIRKDLEVSVYGRDVLVVEDVIDTGLTLNFLAQHLRAGKPESLRFASLLDKPSRRKVDFRIDYVGFVIDDQFVVGYGLDCDERYRHLPNVCILEQE